ncbi:MAG: phosphatidylglycerophosphatase A [Candidatus Cloacimonadaceae bacterium]|jgi:phosphatidylglycerophosphatase A|nr:phosphatidylglycerophosphatase A [Candidatus Cloacimonadota bacterium]MDD3523798.1 phosphatidylglycerophosphatase A [Candidatus Cloacimonadota bacterium]MDY0319389.1 phosphatidylglycerophosphatase A [Candidatus Cloacimonadaceae bacterium]HQB97665.1 phosphatidylglycerophosphatase A [Candidatus Cloacimonadota bacterium]
MNSRKLNISTVFATFFGIGLVPFAPGTFGTLAAFGLYLLMPESWYLGAARYLVAVGVLGLAALSSRLCFAAERVLGEDHGSIVIDEVFGYFTATLFLPYSWLVGLYAFILFRAFDIAKPYPIWRSQRIPRGWGVVIDDILAGVYANLLLQIMIRIYPKFFGMG